MKEAHELWCSVWLAGLSVFSLWIPLSQAFLLCALWACTQWVFRTAKGPHPLTPTPTHNGQKPPTIKKPSDSLWPKHCFWTPRASAASSKWSVRSQLSDFASSMRLSAELLIYCQLGLLQQTQHATAWRKGAHELSFKGKGGDWYIPFQTEWGFCVFWKRPLVCKWGVGSPKAQMKEMSPGMVGMKALGLHCRCPQMPVCEWGTAHMVTWAWLCNCQVKQEKGIPGMGELRKCGGASEGRSPSSLQWELLLPVT